MDKTVTADPRTQSSGTVKPTEEPLQMVGEESWQRGRGPSFYWRKQASSLRLPHTFYVALGDSLLSPAGSQFSYLRNETCLLNGLRFFSSSKMQDLTVPALCIESSAYFLGLYVVPKFLE